VAELDIEQQLRIVALTEANKFSSFRAENGRVVPGSNQVLGAAESFLAFLKGESKADATD
jgi:hypothetical protein